MLWIPMLVLSYAQNETIFQNKHPKDPTMQNLKKGKKKIKKKTKNVMDKKPLILENTKLVLPNPIRQARSCHGEECWYLNLKNNIFGKSDSPNRSTNWIIPSWIILSRVASESDKLPSIIGPCRAALSPLFTKYSSWHFQFASPAVALLKFLPTATVQQLGDLTAMSVGPRMVSTSPQAKRSSSPPLT